MDRDQLAQRLMGVFLAELEEHVRALNRDVLALEKDPAGEQRAELLRTLYRTVHSLKGASRSVGVRPIEAACHRLEEILGAARDGLEPVGPDLVELLLAAADAIHDAGARLREGRDLSGTPITELTARLAAPAGEPRGRPRAPSRPRPAADAARPAPPGRDGAVRVAAEKLDALLQDSGELLVARRRVEDRDEEVAALREIVARYQREWRRLEHAVSTDPHRASPGRTVRARTQRDGAAPGSAAAVLRRARDDLTRLDRALEQLAAAVARDGRMLGQAAGSLEEQVRRVRMVPFAEACEGLERAVRDLARAGGKEVDCVVEGGEVELDRAILEGLKDPLLHLVRNAVDHGVEAPAERQPAGKPPRGRVRIAATLRGAHVEVVVDDDGRGLDLEGLRERARTRRLPQPQDDAEAARLAFLPGLSTSPVVTELSGRGIGLDVVKTRVESLRGTVDVESERRRGTRFTLRVPLTLTIIRALLVVAGGQTLAIPGVDVRTLLRVRRPDLLSIEGRAAVALGEAPVPLASLAGTLGLEQGEPVWTGRTRPVVVVGTRDKPVAFVVDELLREQEIVVKSLGARLVRVRHVAGATILPTGRIALILSTSDLVRSALRGAGARTGFSAASEDEAPRVRKRVLVVEDSVTTRSLEKSILEAAGYEVMAAADGLEAWHLLQEHGADLLVSDVEMPRMDGFALAEAVRGSKRFRALPLILVTALESEKDRARGVDAGADAYLPKSAFEQQQLLDTIAQLL